MAKRRAKCKVSCTGFPGRGHSRAAPAASEHNSASSKAGGTHRGPRSRLSGLRSDPPGFTVQKHHAVPGDEVAVHVLV